MKNLKRLRGEGGLALESTLMVMVLVSVLVVAAFTGMMIVTRTTDIDYRNTRVFYATEGGAEAVMAQLADALEDGALSDSELAAIQPPTIDGFEFDRLNASRAGGVITETITDGPYAGLYSLTQKVDIEASAKDPAGNTSTMIVSAKAQSIPVFQFGIFFDEDLEVTNGPPMEFAGWIHSNGNIYVSSANAWYRDVITTPQKFVWDRKDSHDKKTGVYINDAFGNEVNLTFDSRSHPAPNDFRAKSDYDFDNRVKSDAYEVTPLQVPLPEGMPPITVMQPRRMSDGELERKAKYAWKADWYIDINMAFLNNEGPAAVCGAMTHTRPPTRVAPTAAQCQGIFNWNYDAWYESRERRWVDVLDIDMQALGTWSNGGATNQVRILYVAFTGTPAVTATTDGRGDGFFYIVRVWNGAELVGGSVAVATERPSYMRGDYNTINWVPAAVVGDAITWLSNSWDDADHQSTTARIDQNNTTREQLWNTTDTRINVAILAGHSATPCDHEVVGSNCAYGGGVENYPRFLENWNPRNRPRRTMTYFGSLVSLSQSVFATGSWGYGSYYTAPTRDWNFDMRFENPADLPPGTPTVGNVIRTAFRPVY